MPRCFDNNENDRYIIEEEQACTEIYFIMKGKWGIAFDSFNKDTGQVDTVPAEFQGPKDMKKTGILIAQKRKNFGYCGDYYVLSSKKAMFSYVALS